MRFNIIILILTLPALAMYFNESFLSKNTVNALTLSIENIIKDDKTEQYLNIISESDLIIREIKANDCELVSDMPLEILKDEKYAISLSKCSNITNINIKTNLGNIQHKIRKLYE